jgi:hypothetical protein
VIGAEPVGTATVATLSPLIRIEYSDWRSESSELQSWARTIPLIVCVPP